MRKKTFSVINDVISSNTVSVATNLMRVLGVDYNETVTRLIAKHYPIQNCLAIIKAIFEYHHLRCIAVSLGYDQLLDSPFAIVLHLLEDGVDLFAISVDVREREISYLIPDRNIITESPDRFNEKWTGVAVLVAKMPSHLGSSDVVKSKQWGRFNGMIDFKYLPESFAMRQLRFPFLEQSVRLRLFQQFMASDPIVFLYQSHPIDLQGVRVILVLSFDGKSSSKLAREILILRKSIGFDIDFCFVGSKYNAVHHYLCELFRALQSQIDVNAYHDHILDWFSTEAPDLGTFLKSLGKSVVVRDSNRIEQNSRWAEANAIMVPGVILNEKKVPLGANLADIKYLIQSAATLP